jgi:uncharacterized phage-associated protein
MAGAKLGRAVMEDGKPGVAPPVGQEAVFEPEPGGDSAIDRYARNAKPQHAAAVANAFLTLAGQGPDRVDQMRIQKLLYFAEGWHLAMFGKPLMKEEFVASPYGPRMNAVIKGWVKVGKEALDPKRDRLASPALRDLIFSDGIARIQSSTGDLEGFLKSVYDTYRDFSTPLLYGLTLEERGAFHALKTAHPINHVGMVISKDAIRDEFLGRLREAHAVKADEVGDAPANG